jgi:hypothetical protein
VLAGNSARAVPRAAEDRRAPHGASGEAGSRAFAANRPERAKRPDSGGVERSDPALERERRIGSRRCGIAVPVVPSGGSRAGRSARGVIRYRQLRSRTCYNPVT